MKEGSRKKDEAGKRILILGGSGFIGHALYKELCNYYDTYGTYCSARRSFEGNQQFYRYDMREDDIYRLLDHIKPQFIISALRGGFLLTGTGTPTYF